MNEIVQRSELWFAARTGCVTASRIADVVARTKTGWGAARKAYLHDLVLERLTSEHVLSGTGAARRWGEEVEPEAKIAYEFYRDTPIVDVGFVSHQDIGWTGASPDGLVGEDGLVEFKCPTVSVHLETLDAEIVPPEYVLQMQWQMACTGRAWCDFASYDPRFPEPMRLYVQRVHRDDAKIAELEAAVIAFLAEVHAKEMALRAKYEPPVRATEAERILMAG